MSKYPENEFSEKIGRLTKSRAYLDLCEEVSGYRAYLFNMMDREQLDYILHTIPITPSDTVLDLGCGVGSILDLLTAQYGCAGIGVDMLDNSSREPSGQVRYIRGDIDAVTTYDLSPSVTLSVDSLYFSRDLYRLVRDLAHMKRNRLYLFYSQYLFDEAGDKSLLPSDKTRLAQALAKAGLSCRTLDFSENERQLYIRMEKALKKLEPAFTAEGNADLYAQKLAEVYLGLKLFGQGRASRYLYIGETD